MRWTLCGAVIVAGLLGGGTGAIAQQATEPSAAPLSRVTLNLAKAPAEEAMDQIGRQAGVELVTDQSMSLALAEPVSISVKDAPFWPTFIEICRQTKVNFDPFYANNGQTRGHGLRLSGVPTGESRYAKLPMCQAEGFTLLAQSAQRSYNLDYDASSTPSASFAVSMTVLSDPALSIASISAVQATEAVDENGMSLMPGPDAGGVSYSSQPNQLMHQASVRLSYPAGAGRKIAHLKGEFTAVAIVRYETIEIEHPLTADTLTKELPDYDLVIEPLKAVDGGNGRYQLKVAFHSKKGPQAQARGEAALRRGGRGSRDFWGLMNGIRITDAEGRRYGNSGGGAGGAGGAEATYECWTLFLPGSTGAGEPARLSWTVPAETREIRVPFEMKDLPIP